MTAARHLGNLGNAMGAELTLQQLLGRLLDRPIAFQRAFVRLGAGTDGALMISQAMYWSNRTDDADGWFYKTQTEWEEETGLTRSAQETTRKKLVKAGALEEKKQGVPCRLYYRVNLPGIIEKLSAGQAPSSLQGSSKLGCAKPANKDAETPQASLQDSSTQACGVPANIHTEITTETTADIPAAGAAAPSQPGEEIPVLEGELVEDDAPENTPGTEPPSDKPRVEIPADMPGPKDPQAKTYKPWANYAIAYRKRYKVWPAWNATAAGQISQLVDRMGAELAPKVAAYYVTINDSRLINDCHPVSLLLRGCEGYRTQYLTGRQMNGTTARQLEQSQANLNAAQTAAESLRAKEGKRNAFL